MTADAIGYTGANFYGQGSLTTGDLSVTVDRMSSVSVWIDSLPSATTTTAEVAVSDPTQLADTVTATVVLPSGRNWQVKQTNGSVTASLNARTLTMTAKTSGADGRTHRTWLTG